MAKAKPVGLRLIAGSAVNLETGCWEWQKKLIHNGYGRIRVNGTQLPVHRAAFEYWTGSIPEGMYVCHSCDNRRCINPAHLWLGTAKDNAQDRETKGRSNRRTKLSNSDVDSIKSRCDSGRGICKDLASEFKVSIQTISAIKTGARWKS